MRWRDLDPVRVGTEAARSNVLALATMLHEVRPASGRVYDLERTSCTDPAGQCEDLDYIWFAGDAAKPLCRAPAFFNPAGRVPMPDGTCAARAHGGSALPPQVTKGGGVAAPPLYKTGRMIEWVEGALRKAAREAADPVVRCMAIAYLFDRDVDAGWEPNIKLADWLLHLLQRERPWG